MRKGRDRRKTKVDINRIKRNDGRDREQEERQIEKGSEEGKGKKE